jgi:hypothetical protein
MDYVKLETWEDISELHDKKQLMPYHVKIVTENNRVDLLQYIYRLKYLKRSAFNNVLNIAAENGFLDIIRYMLTRRSFSKYKFSQAIIKSSLNQTEENLNVAEYLIRRCPNYHPHDICLLDYFSKNYNFEYIKLLAKYKFGPKNKTTFLNNILSSQASIEELEWISEFFLCIFTQKSLYVAIKAKNFSFVKFIVEEKKIDPARDASHSVRLAIRCDFLEGLEYLFPLGTFNFNYNYVPCVDYTDLFKEASIKSKDIRILKFVAGLFSDLEIQNIFDTGHNIYVVGRFDNLEILEYFVKRGVNFSETIISNLIYQNMLPSLEYLGKMGKLCSRNMDLIFCQYQKSSAVLSILLPFDFDYAGKKQIDYLMGNFVRFSKFPDFTKVKILCQDNLIITLFPKREKLKILAAIDMWDVITRPQTKNVFKKFNFWRFILKPMSLHTQLMLIE